MSEERKSSRLVPRGVRSILNSPVLRNSARTTAAAVVSLLVARLFRLPEIYWAVITTMIVMQSSLEASLPIAWRRLAGTALGALAGALIGSYFRPTVWVFGAGLFLLGLVCGVLARSNKQLEDTLDKTAYRYAGITLTITILISRSQPIWIVAMHRFFEVSVGIGVGLIMTALWPEREAAH